MGAAEATAQALRDAAAARGAVLEASALRGAAAVASGADAGVAMRAIGRVAEEHVRAQRNLEATLPMAVKDAATRANAGDATGEIDDDWLTRWMRLAEEVSDPEMQELFAKVLAGEAHRPGGFLPETLNVLSLMTRELASIFQRLCRLSINDPRDEVAYVLLVFGGEKKQPLEPFGVLYSHLLVMQTNGLLMSTGRSGITFDRPVPSAEVDYGGKAATLRSREGNLSGSHEVVVFSPAGHQLRQLIALEPVPEYTKALNEYLDKHGIDLIIEGEHR